MTWWILSPIRRWWGQCLLPHVYERGGFYARGEFLRPARSVELRWKGKVLRGNGTKDVGYWCSVELIRCRTRLSTWPKGCSQYVTVCSQDWCRYRDCPSQARWEDMGIKLKEMADYISQCSYQHKYHLVIETPLGISMPCDPKQTGNAHASSTCPTKLCTQSGLLRTADLTSCRKIVSRKFCRCITTCSRP